MSRKLSRRSLLAGVAAGGVVGAAGCLSPGHRGWSRSIPGAVDGMAAGDGVVSLGNKNKHAYSIDARNGETVWSFETGGPVREAPIPLDDGAVVRSSDGTVYGLSAAGEERWRHAFEVRVQDLAVVDGTAYLLGTTFETGESPTDRLRLLAVDATTGEEYWRRTLDEADGTLAVAGGTVGVSVDETRALHGFDRETGEERWTDAGGTVRGVGDTLLNLNRSGHWAYGPDGTKRWGRRVENGPRLRGYHAGSDTVYFRDLHGLLSAVDATTGEERWRVEDTASAVAVLDDTVVVGQSNDYDVDAPDVPTLLAKAPESGDVQWQTAKNRRECRELRPDGDGVVAEFEEEDYEPRLRRFGADGSGSWQSDAEIGLGVVVDGRVIGGSDDGIAAIEPGYL